MSRSVRLKRSSYPVPKYRHHRATGQAVVTLSGRDHYLGPHGTKTSLLEYDRLVGEWLAGGRRPTAALDGALSVAELAQAYWRFAKGYYVKNGRPTAHLETVRVALRIFRTWYGHTPAAEFGPLALRAVQERLVAEGHSRNYINGLCSTIRRVVKWAASQEMLPVEIHQALATVPGLKRGRSAAREPEPVKPVADALVDATLPHLSPIVADMVRFQRLTGCRPQEVCTIRPRDIDTSGEVWLYTPDSHKTEHHNRSRVLCIGPQAQNVLRPYLLRDKEMYCFVPTESESKRRAVLHDARKTPLSCGNRPGTNRRLRPKKRPGGCYSTDSYRRAIHYGSAKAFPPPKELSEAERKPWRIAHQWHPNQLRHTAATEVRRRFGLEAAQAVLGHARADVTQIYAERDMTLAASVMREVG